MSTLPDVTVIVVGYNHARFIEKCLGSIAAQTHRPARVLVMDDASPDDTAEVARAWATRTGYPVPVDVRRNPQNIGLCATLNLALDSITTPLYAYISADDHMEPERLARQTAVMAAAPDSVAGIYSDAHIEDEGGERTGLLASQHFGWPEEREGSSILYDQMLDHNWIPAPSVLLRASAAKAVGGYDADVYFEDLDLWLRLLKARYSFRCVDEPLVTFRVHAASLGSSTFRHDNVRFIEALRTILHKHLLGATPARRRRVEGKLWWLAVRSARQGRCHPDVLRDLMVFRQSTDASHPVRVAVLAVVRGACGRIRSLLPMDGDSR